MARDPIHPGKFLTDELQALAITAEELAGSLHIASIDVQRLLSGQCALTSDMALRLSRWLGTSAEMWLNLQTLYELRLAEQKSGAEIRRCILPRLLVGEQEGNALHGS
ncbi:MAG: HigA family addiction module antidote protein [Magnetococcales bacterium]|nr:HigA family addiction module antidote protein [Magnetococcales bacterium]